MVATVSALILRILSNPIGNVFQKRLTGEQNHPLIVNFLTFFILGIFCIIPACRVNWGNISGECWYYGIIAGIFGATGNAFLVKALQKGDLSVLGPINSYKSVVGILGGMLFLQEMPNLYGIGGMLLIIFGSYFVLDTMPEGFSLALLKNKEIQYRVWAMVLTAVEAIFIKKVILYSSVSVSFFFWCWFGAFFSFLLLFLFRLRPIEEAKQIKRRHLPLYACLVLCIGTMQYTTNYVFSHMNVGYALALFQLSTIVSIFLGYRLFKEQNIRRKLLGAVIMITGSIIIILWN
ncbi:MAG: EamA family transporter [Bacteroides sp.]|nr:EamA family transporter [Bacteroides sp.]